jgi:hypothetical protein
MVANTGLENIKKAIQTDQELYSWRSPNRRRRRRGRNSVGGGGSSPGRSDHTSDYSPSIAAHESENLETLNSEEDMPDYLADKKNMEEIKDIQDPLEEWLYKSKLNILFCHLLDETPLIGENEAAQQFFKVKDNYELFFTFLLEPTMIECTGSVKLNKFPFIV